MVDYLFHVLLWHVAVVSCPQAVAVARISSVQLGGDSESRLACGTT